MAVDYFLEIDGIEGESTVKGHEKDLDIQSFSWGESQSGSASSGGGAGAGKVSMQDLHFVASVSKASPKLLLACATGQHIKRAVLFARKAGSTQIEFLKVTLEDVLVSSFQTGGSGAADVLPMDQVSLNFAKITYSYTPQNPDGSAGAPITASYDLKSNTGA